MTRVGCLLFAWALTSTSAGGCGGDGGGGGDAGADSSTAADAGGLPSTCTGACQDTAAVASFAATVTFDQAFYGINYDRSPATLYIEAHEGAAAGCPTQGGSSDHTLVIANTAIATTSAAASSSANLVDLVGDLLPGAPTAPSLSGSIATVALNVCTDCAGVPAPSDPDGFVRVDLDYQFDGGTIIGPLYAIHCDSLDAR